MNSIPSYIPPLSVDRPLVRVISFVSYIRVVLYFNTYVLPNIRSANLRTALFFKTIYIALSTKNLKEYAKKSSHRSKNVIK